MYGMCFACVCVCVCVCVFFFKSYKHSKRIFIFLEGRETPSLPMHTLSFSLFFSPLLLHLSLLFLCPRNSLLDPLCRWLQNIKPRWNFKDEKFLGFCFPCWHAHFLIDLSNKRSSLIQDKKPCEILERAVRFETFSWVIIEWKITLLLEFVLLFSLLTCTFLLIFFFLK